MKSDLLDIGCGKHKHPNSIGLDINGSLDGVDVVHEIKSKVQLPFKDNKFKEIYLTDIVEHVDDIPWLLSEVHRVGIKDALIKIKYPHYSGRNAYGDVTHKHYLGINAFDHFIPDTLFGEKYQYYTLFNRHFPFAKENLELEFKIGFISPTIYKLCGTSFYEGYASKLLPISNIKLDLKIIK